MMHLSSSYTLKQSSKLTSSRIKYPCNKNHVTKQHESLGYQGFAACTFTFLQAKILKKKII